MFKDNKNLLIIALIVIVNSIGYGIIIPILYPYSVKFGLSDFQNGLLFAVFSICQFIATPIIGRLSDKFGRRPLLLISITGTALSFFMMAFAPNAIILFIARALDGITAGNIPVAQAVIADTTDEKHRARAFGIVFASLSFGFIIGPAIAGLTVGISQSLPFIIAGIITIISVIITALFLPETNKHIGEVKKGKLFDFSKLWHSLYDPNVGRTFLITLIYNFAFACAIIYGYQPFVIKILKLTEVQNSLLFVLFGVVGLLSQVLLIQRYINYFGLKKGFTIALAAGAIAFTIMFFSRSLPIFIVAAIIMGMFNGLTQTLITTILSKETDAKSQGTMLGLNASYMSIGQIFGPIVGGAIATIFIPLPLLAGALSVLVCLYISFQVLKPGVKKESAF